MSWIQKLYETYNRCNVGTNLTADYKQPIPISHTTLQAHIEISIDQRGTFRRATVIPKEETLIPATEKSAGRSSGEAPHPLCDKIHYCASDYPQYGGQKPSYFDGYIDQLTQWCSSEFSHPKVNAVLEYVNKGTVVADLVREKIMHVENGKLLTTWGIDTSEPDIFKYLTKKAGIIDQGDAFVRWRVEIEGVPLSATWEDIELINAWINFYVNQKVTHGICLITGEDEVLADQHPSRLRHGGDKAKLISSNDRTGFTFRGRFLDAKQACGIGFDATQKAHNTLRWLIGRQAYRNRDQVIVAWAVSGERIPDPFANSHELFNIDSEQQEESEFQGDIGQALSKRLSKLITGYKATLGNTNDIVVMALDSVTTGRMAITFYRELTGSELLDRIQSWHKHFAWHQKYSKDIHFVGAPAPREIAQAAFGHRLDDDLRKATIERLLPCIIDGRAIPYDLVEASIRLICNRTSTEHRIWEKNLGIACALFSGYYKERSYQMSLEHDRISRDYLYGRLLAIAEHIEGRALHLAGEKRDTSAAKLMQRFADRPCSTWRTIELSLSPYKTRLRTNRPSFLLEMEKQIDEIIGSFQEEDFMDEQRLTGEFLLGYHCQRQALWIKQDAEVEEDADDN